MATYYVRSSGGDDGNAGTSFGAAFATLQKALDVGDDGDLILVCADGTHLPAATVDVDTNTQVAATPVRIRGCAADGTDNGTVATISGANLGAGTSLIQFNLATKRTIWENLRFTAGKLYNLYQSSNGVHTFRNCRIDNAANNGVYNVVSLASLMEFIDCEIDTNGAAGYAVNSAARGRSRFVRCSIHHNTGIGILDSAYTAGNFVCQIEGCLIYRNGGIGVSVFGGSDYAFLSIRNTTIALNGGAGISIGTIGYLEFEKLILANNNGYGINTNTGGLGQFFVCDRICSDSNTSGHIDINSGTLPGAGHVLASPAFSVTTDGSENLVPTNTDLLKTIALPRGGTTYEYIGALQPARAAAGGGARIIGSPIIRGEVAA